MPVLVRETPLGRELYNEGFHDGRRQVIATLTAALLRHRFGDDPRVANAAALLADLFDDQATRSTDDD